MNLRIHEKLLVLILVPLALLLAIVGAVLRLSHDISGAAATSYRSSQALQSAGSLLVTLVDAETGMRGYVLTGNRRFAEPYRAAAASFELRTTTFEDAAKRGASDEFDNARVVVGAREAFSSIDRYVRLVDAKRGSLARSEVASGSAKAEMDGFRRAVADFERAQDRREAAAASSVTDLWTATHALLLIGTAIAVATSLILYLTISRSIVRRLQALKKDANAIAAGDVPHMKIAGNDAISQVERSFYDMAQLLTKRREDLARASSLQRAILDGTGHAIITTGTDGIITSFNPGAERILGYSADEIVGHFTPEKFHVPEELAARAPIVAQEVGHAVRPGYEVLVARAELGLIEKHEWTFVRADGTHVPISKTMTSLRDEGGHVFGYAGVSEDITQRKAAERALVQSEVEQRELARQLRSLHLIANTVATKKENPIDRSLRLGLEQLELGWAYLGVIDEAHAQIVVENSVGADAQECEPPISIGRSLAVNEAFIGRTPRSTAVFAAECLTTLRVSSRDVPFFGDCEAYVVAPIYVSGSLYGAIGFIGSAVRHAAFSVTNRDFVRVTADLVGAAIERGQERARLDGLAFFDALTGLPNRVLMLDRLAQTVLAAKRYHETFALLYLDLDGFKAVNDTYGHGVGDEALKAASRRFEKLMRTSDTVARLGGDEFVILAPKLAHALDAGDLASRVVASMHRPIVIDGVEHALTVSVGISVFPHDGVEAGGLIDKADAALYVSKAKGKNTFTFASNAALPKLQPPDTMRSPAH